MANFQYWRDLPDGSRQFFSERIEKPDVAQRYYDDVIQKFDHTETSEPLEFLFFGKEQSYPNRVVRHNSDVYILHYVTEGSGTFNGRRISAGEGFLVVPGVAHQMASDSDDPWHFKWISFRGSHAKWQMKQIGLGENNPCFRFCFAERLEELFDDVIYGVHADCDLNTYMQGIFYIILSYHKKQYLSDQSKEVGMSRYASLAMQYVDAHYRENLRVDEIAEALHISRKYLCSVLERAIGMSTKEYLLKRRTEVASELLLRTAMSVSEIAQEVGYGDYTQFSRMFRKQTGLSPQQYRKQNAVNPSHTQSI